MHFPKNALPLEYIIVAIGIGYEVCQLANAQTWTSCVITGTCIPLLCWLYRVELNFSHEFNHLKALFRPSGSPGLWCIILVPLCLFLSCHGKKYHCSATYSKTSLASISLLLSTVLWMWNNKNCKTASPDKMFSLILLYLIPSAVCVSLWHFYSDAPLLDGVVGSAILLGTYNVCLPRLLTLAAKSFTLGEAVIVSHGVSIFCLSAYLTLRHWLPNSVIVDELQCITLICQVAIIGTMTFVFILVEQPNTRSVGTFYGVAVGMAIFLMIPVLYILLGMNPFLWLYRLILKDTNRVLLLLYWIILTAMTVLIASIQQSFGYRTKTVVRKYFHILIVVAYLPGLFFDSHLLYLASGIALGVFLIIECIRVCRIPPLGKLIDSTFSEFLDEKDQGQLILTHFFLLIGCSLPLWVIPELLTRKRSGDNAFLGTPLAMFSGLLAIGFGDTMASVGGTWVGKHCWPGIKKTVEGTAFSVVTQVVVCQLFSLTGLTVFPNWTHTHLVGIFLSACLEAFTSQIDNLVLPLFLYIVLIL